MLNRPGQVAILACVKRVCDGFWFIRERKKGWTPERLSDQSEKTFLITGANAGAGFQAARTLLRKNAKVVMLNRSAEKSEAAIAELQQEFGANADVSFIRMDLSVLKSVREAVLSQRLRRG